MLWNATINGRYTREQRKQFVYHCGQGIDDACTPSVAFVREALADWSHIIVAPRVHPAITVRISATAATRRRTDL
jgi:hypothetical protein